MTGDQARLALSLAGLIVVACLPAQAQVLRVAAGGRELAHAAVANAGGYRALPITLLVPFGAEVEADAGVVVVRLFDDTLRFYPGYAEFQVNVRMESLSALAYQEDGVLFVAQWFFTNWLPERYPQRLAYRDGVLRLTAGEVAATRQPAADALGAERERDSAFVATATPAVDAKRAAPSKDSARAAAIPQPDDGFQVPDRRRDPDAPWGDMLGFIDARASGVFDSNIDHAPAPRRSYGTVARLRVGIQSALTYPFLMARYDLAAYRFTNSDVWNRTTHDVSVDLAPSLSTIRLRLGAALRLGAWTEDRQPANQIIVKPQIEIRPTPIHLINLYVMQSARRIEVGAATRKDTFRLAGVGYYRWWHDGGFRVDARYEVNESESEPSRYAGWTGYNWIRIPLGASQRFTLETSYNRRWYARSFVDPAGTVARWDRRWTSSASLASELAGSGWELGLGYTFEDNLSNNPYAVYQAHRVEFTVRRRW